MFGLRASSRSLLTLALLMLGASGCGFESADEPAMVENSCSADRDCDANAACEQGMCVARSVDNPLTVMLEITPLRMPDGSDPLPFVYGGHMLDGPQTLPVTLPGPVVVSGVVRYRGAPLPSEISFTPIDRIPNVAAKVVSASIGEDSASGDTDYAVRLLDLVEYRMSVRPRDPLIPPFGQVIRARRDERRDVDYDQIEFRERSYTIRGVAGRALTVRAVDRRGERVSSTVPLDVPAGADDETVTLLYQPGSEGPFQLRISPQESYAVVAEADSAPAALSTCNTATPTSPVYSVDEGLARGAVTSLPSAPDRIRFQGAIELCDGAGADSPFLPLSLRSDAIAGADERRGQGFEQEDDEPAELSVSYSVTTDAMLHEGGQYRFCVDVLPGTYDVVVTPAPGIKCAVFAERRLISAPDDVASTGTLFELPDAFRLTGTLRTNDLMPLPGATVAGIALGRSAAWDLDEVDRSRLTQFNRSNETLSDEDGRFVLSLDFGSYDLVIKPTAESGFPWRVHHDINLNQADLETQFDMRSPLSIAGQLAYRGATDETAQASLAGAEVRAFAVIGDPFDTDRSIAIGQATADGNGAYTLLLPPTLQEGL